MSDQTKQPTEHKFVRRELGDKKKSGNGKKLNREQEEHINEQLTEIYSNGDGSMPDMKHIDKTRHRRVTRAFIALLLSCVFLSAVVWAGFFIIQPASNFSEKDVVLSISGDESIQAGQEVRYRVRYRNSQNVALSNVSLQVRYPEGFVFTDSSRSATGTAKDEWKVGSLQEGESGYVDIFGRMYGDLQKDQSFRVFLNYRPENFHSDFQSVTTLTTHIVDAPLVLSVDGENSITSGGVGNVTINVKPKNGVVSKNVVVSVTVPEQFSKKKFTPIDDKDTPLQWTFDTLDAEKKIDLSGIFVGGAEDTPIDFGVVARGNGYVYASGTLHMVIRKTALNVVMAINGAASDSSVSAGDILNATVSVKNSGAEAINNVVVRAIFDAPYANKQSILKWATLEDVADGTVTGEQLSPQSRRGTIAWDSSKVPALRSIGSGQEVNIDFHLSVKDGSETDLAAYTTGEIIASAEAQYGSGKNREILSANPLKLTLLSDTTLEVRDDIGETPAGQESHTVSWVIKNSFHELSHLELQTDVYGDVTIDPSAMVVGAGKAHFDAQAKKIIWSIDSMPTSVDVLALSFPIVINKKNPTQTDLTSKVKFTAHDVVVDQDLTRSGEGIVLGQ